MGVIADSDTKVDNCPHVDLSGGYESPASNADAAPAMATIARMCCSLSCSNNEKADVAEHPQVFDHIGLLTNEPLGAAELLSI